MRSETREAVAKAIHVAGDVYGGVEQQVIEECSSARARIFAVVRGDG